MHQNMSYLNFNIGESYKSLMSYGKVIQNHHGSLMLKWCTFSKPICTIVQDFRLLFGRGTEFRVLCLIVGG
jgi:hypothetical protein